jgi:CRISPR-associated protein Cas1
VGYSDNARAFSRIPVVDQVRLEDRVSFLYLEHAQVVQDRTGVWAIREGEPGLDGQRSPNGPDKEHVQIPVGGICVVMLGPGTSVTQPAMTSMANSGATVMFTGGGGMPAYASAVPLTSSSRWAQAQARMWANDVALLQAARHLYLTRFPAFPTEVAITLNAMRGLEGRMVRDTYQSCARNAGQRYFKRDPTADDPVNTALNVANGILYGCAASACAALAVNPALGIIHRGNARALLFDLADVYKTTISIPAAFRAASEADPAQAVRKDIRAQVHRRRLLPAMVALLCEILADHLDGADRGDQLMGDGGLVPGHTNYAPELDMTEAD